jgi:hypothetical protein
MGDVKGNDAQGLRRRFLHPDSINPQIQCWEIIPILPNGPESQLIRIILG